MAAQQQLLSVYNKHLNQTTTLIDNIINYTLSNILENNEWSSSTAPTTATTTLHNNNNNNNNINNNNNNIINNNALLHAPYLLNPHYYNNNNNINNSNDHNSLLTADHVRLEHAPHLSNSALIKVYVLSLMAILSLLGNILTMWNIFKTRLSRRNKRHSWSAIYALIFHLSIADVMVSGFCIIGEAIWYYTVQWVADDITCKLVKFFQMFSLYISTYVLVLIGIDRWIAVKYPMKSLNMAKRCYRLLAAIYVLSFLLSLPQVFIFHVSRGPFVEEFYQCVTHGFYTADWQEQLYGAFTLFFTFILPLIVLLVTYLSTFCTISNSEKMFQNTRTSTYTTGRLSMQTNRQRLIHKAKMKSLRISVVIIFAFLICWTPYNVMMILFMFTNIDQRLGADLQSAIFFFGMSNSLVNPVIYGAFHLCPAHKKSRNAKLTKSALYRADSQRTSMQTGVTQIDSTMKQPRNLGKANFTRTLSTCSANQKESLPLTPLVQNDAKIIRINKTNDNKYITETVQTMRTNCDDAKDNTSNLAKDNLTNTFVFQNAKTLNETNEQDANASTLV